MTAHEKYEAVRAEYTERKLTPLVRQIDSKGKPMLLTEIRAEVRRIGGMDYCGTYRMHEVLTACGWVRMEHTYNGRRGKWWYPPLPAE